MRHLTALPCLMLVLQALIAARPLHEQWQQPASLLRWPVDWPRERTVVAEAALQAEVEALLPELSAPAR